MSAFRRRLSVAFSLILLLASPCAAEPAPGPKYNIINLNSRISLEKFASYLRAGDPSAPRIHNTGIYSFIVMTVQEGDILKAALIPPADHVRPQLSRILPQIHPARQRLAAVDRILHFSSSPVKKSPSRNNMPEGALVFTFSAG